MELHPFQQRPPEPRNFDFIRVYWLSGWFQEHFEIWTGKKDPDQPDPAACRYTLYLLLPLAEEEPGHLTIFQRGEGLSFTVDWFSGEEFPLRVFWAENPRQLLLMSEFQRETVFIHLT